MSLTATEEIEPSEPDEPGTHEIYLAIKEAMENLGFNELWGSDNILGIGTVYVYDATGKQWEITISSQN